MNSPDPWRVMLSSPPGERMVVPDPFYGNPFYGDTAYGRSFVGAEAPPPPPLPRAPARGKLTAQVAPILAPATDGYTARLLLDHDQILHAAICIDGKCYETSINLAPAIAAIMEKFARYHTDLHAAIPSTVVVGAIDAAVGAAGDALVGTLVDRHVTVACAGFLDDILGAVKGLPVIGDVMKPVGDMVKQLSPVLKMAAPMVATAFGGPAAGAAASQFAGPLIDSLAGGKDTPEKKAIEAQAQVDPVVAQHLATTKNAVAHTVAAHHVHRTATRAAQGHPGSQRDIHRLVQDAERGDPVAHAATPLVQNGFVSELLKRATGGGGDSGGGSGGGLDFSSLFGGGSGGGAGGLASLFGGGVSGGGGAWPWYEVVG